MTDSIAVLPPGWRALDSNGDPFTDAVLSFFDAGTSDALEVFSDSGLATSLGTEVDCNAGGEPVTSGNVPTLIYTGTDPYKVTISSVLGGFTRTFDNIKGALDTSSFLTSAAVADQSVVNTSSNRSITAADKGKLINANCSGGVLTATFDDAATLGDGFFVGIRHAGTANQVKITGDGTDTFAISGASPTGFSLTGLGHTVWIGCDGTNFKIHSECPPLIGGTVGTIVIADRLSTPPGSPNPGARYIVGSSPTGAWSGFAEHDIAEADGFGNWFNYTPATDCGWIAYVQDENTYYGFFGSAWGTTVSGLTEDTNPDSTADYIEIFDASASANKKIPLYLLPGALIAIIEDQKSQNTAGGTFTSGADRTRDLNTLVYNRNSVVSLASNQFTLPAGNWFIKWSAPARDVTENQSFLYDVTGAAEVKRGTSARANESSDETTISSGSARVTPSSSNTYQIRHRCGATVATSGFGIPANFGTEVYTRVEIYAA